MNKLKEARQRAGLTQKEVAERAGIAESAYWRYEEGKRTPNVYMALKIAASLNADIAELFPFHEEVKGNIKKI